MTARPSYLDRLAARTAAVGSVLCLGMDPQPEQLPAGFSQDLQGVEAFCRLLLDAALPAAAAVKPNLAFFEAFGSAGLAALERLRARVPADVPFIADAKRGDIGSTAARHAVALFESLGADAMTASPYLGRDALDPLLAHEGAFVYLLCRTSNPAAAEVQGLRVSADAALGAPEEPLYARVARLAAGWGGDSVGLVVGATAPRELQEIRAIVPGLSFLVPGVGAQGGELEPVLRDGPAAAPPAGRGAGRGLLVNVSRGIAGASSGVASGGELRDVGEALAAAARSWSARLPVLS